MGDISVAIQTDPEAHPASCTMGKGIKRPGRGVDHPSVYSAEVKESVELYLQFLLCAFMAYYRGL